MVRTSSRVIPALDAWMIQKVEQQLIVDIEIAERDIVVEHRPLYGINVVDGPKRLKNLFVGAVAKDEITDVRNQKNF